mmetsp:Transcript_29873/g.44114  ORF Transcript_29873/g.44114 Transcript_29873/m.44114 type:complete len:320 (-) Transcript_29873:209-1168(-)
MKMSCMRSITALLLLLTTLADGFVPSNNIGDSRRWSFFVLSAEKQRGRFRKVLSYLSPRRILRRERSGDENVLSNSEKIPSSFGSPEMQLEPEPKAAMTEVAVVDVNPAEALLAEVSDAFNREDFNKAFALLDSKYKEDPSFVRDREALLWRYAKACFEKFQIAETPEEQESYLRKGQGLTQDGMQKYPESGYMLKWNAILLGRLGKFQPTKLKMQNSFLIRDNLKKAQDLLPRDPSIVHALGEWCSKIASISFVERNVAKLLFGMPPESSYEQAFAYFEQAYALKPTMKYANLAAEALVKMGRKTEAQEWMEKAEPTG